MLEMERICIGDNYCIVQSRNMATLVEEVDKWIKDGWKCQGGVSFNYTAHIGDFYIQAMVK
jgi:hypothetical protein